MATTTIDPPPRPSRRSGIGAPARLAAFAGVLILAFAAALGAGSAFGPDRTGAAKADAGHGGMGEHGAMAPQAVRGLAVSDDGLSLELDTRTAQRGRPFDLAFRIVGADGQTVRDFDVEHTKRMHLIIARRDLTGFQHLHPTQRADGTWTVPATLREAGSYRVFADFSVDETARTLAADLDVDGAVRSEPLPAPVESVDVDGLNVELSEGASHAGEESELAFTVTRDGEPVELEDYLGAKGHLVALREGDLAFLHVHPDEDRLSFMATFPTAGRYRLFLQFQIEGRIHTAAFTQEVER